MKKPEFYQNLIMEVHRFANGCLMLGEPSMIATKAELVHEAYQSFRTLVVYSKGVNFEDWEVFQEEYNSYYKKCVPVVEPFTGKTIYFPFQLLEELSEKVIKKDNSIIPMKRGTRKGNEVIGQVYLEDNTMAFSPQLAVFHSLNHSATRLLQWLKLFQKRYMKDRVIM